MLNYMNNEKCIQITPHDPCTTASQIIQSEAFYGADYLGRALQISISAKIVVVVISPGCTGLALKNPDQARLNLSGLDWPK